jgi:hypothetical protein
MVLFAVMATLAGLTLLAGTVFTVIATDIGITGNYKTGSEAFYQADAGSAYVRDRIGRALAAGTLVLDGQNKVVNIPPAAGYTFDPVTNLLCMGNTNIYMFRVTGRRQSSQATLEVTVRRKPLLAFGVFGNELIDGKATGKFMSYDARLTPNPTPADSTGEVDIGSNEDVTTYSGTLVDGNLVLGQDTAGIQGLWNAPGQGQIVTGEAELQMDRIDPDPLGAVSGSLAAEFAAVAVSNNNALASPPIPANGRVRLGNGDTLTLTSGNYYLAELDLGNGASLVIDATAGPVNIYLTGAADLKNGSSVNITGMPTDLSLYANSSAGVRLFNNGDFKGTVYAPLATVEIKNTGNFYGLAWGRVADIKNSGEIYVDMNTVYKRISNEIKLVNWKDVRS